MADKKITPLSINLKKIRESKEISGDALGKKVGVSRQTIFRYESGEITVPYDKIIELAKALNVNVGELMGISPQDKAKSDFEIISLYNKLNERDQTLIKSMMESMISNY